jgi:signal transduction histidine kinase
MDVSAKARTQGVSLPAIASLLHNLTPRHAVWIVIVRLLLFVAVTALPVYAAAVGQTLNMLEIVGAGLTLVVISRLLRASMPHLANLWLIYAMTSGVMIAASVLQSVGVASGERRVLQLSEFIYLLAKLAPLWALFKLSKLPASGVTRTRSIIDLIVLIIGPAITVWEFAIEARHTAAHDLSFELMHGIGIPIINGLALYAALRYASGSRAVSRWLLVLVQTIGLIADGMFAYVAGDGLYVPGISMVDLLFVLQAYAGVAAAIACAREVRNNDQRQSDEQSEAIWWADSVISFMWLLFTFAAIIRELTGAENPGEDIHIVISACVLTVGLIFVRQLANVYESAQLRSERLAAATNSAVRDERARIARDLHDSVNQAMFAASISIHTAGQLLDSDASKAREAQGFAQQMIEGGLAEMRALIFELRPDSIERDGLVSALELNTTAIAKRHGIATSLNVVGGEPMIATDTKIELYRIAVEALHNAVRHGQPKAISISLAGGPRSLCLTVQDDGRGFDPNQPRPGHFGLSSMRERATAIGAHLDIQSSNTGTRISVAIA